MKTRYYGPDMASTSFIIGDVVSYLNSEYICITNLTIASYPGTAGQIPNAAASAFWYKINQTNEIWAHNQPKLLGQNPAPDYAYNTFFGQAVENEYWVVVNPKSNNPFSVLNMEQIGNNVNVTQVTVETDGFLGEDLDITSTNRNYKVIYNAITSSIPLNENGVRSTDMYLLIKFKKKNWSSVPYTVDSQVKILSMLKSIFEEKR